MKKIIAICCLILIIGIVGCENKDNTKTFNLDIQDIDKISTFKNIRSFGIMCYGGNFEKSWDSYLTIEDSNNIIEIHRNSTNLSEAIKDVIKEYKRINDCITLQIPDRGSK